MEPGAGMRSLPEGGEASTESESSPSWASSTPGYSSVGLAFDFSTKCAISAESLSPPPSDWGALSRRKGSADSSDGTEKVSTGKLSRLLRRTQSAGCSKDAPSHALFLKKPVTKTKSAECPSSCDSKQSSRKTLAQDMKLRLSFLRRRHTDSLIQQPSVRPSPEEAQKWAQSFNDLISNKYGLALFKAFLCREFSEENIEFWLACEEFKKARPNKLSTKAKKIFEDFVAVQSPKEVNLEPSMRSNIENCLNHPDQHAFDQAQRRVQGMLERDAYLRFLQSELYLELLQQEEDSSSRT